MISSQYGDKPGPVYCGELFGTCTAVPHGPFASDQEFWNHIAKQLHGDLPTKVVKALRAHMPACQPYTFTHCCLYIQRIMVLGDKLIGITFWDEAGYFPVWWEYASGLLSDADVEEPALKHEEEWRTLLRKHMPAHKEGHQFWNDFLLLTKYPDLDKAGKELFAKLME